jgi:hypothetical protein
MGEQEGNVFGQTMQLLQAAVLFRTVTLKEPKRFGHVVRIGEHIQYIQNCSKQTSWRTSPWKTKE